MVECYINNYNTYDTLMSYIWLDHISIYYQYNIVSNLNINVSLFYLEDTSSGSVHEYFFCTTSDILLSANAFTKSAVHHKKCNAVCI